MAAEKALVPSGFFVMRTPLLPVDVLAGWGTDGADPRERLRSLAARPEVAEALWLASPELTARWQENTTTEGPLDRVERAVAAYLIRAATRPTPFGLFAGVGVGRLTGRDTALHVPPLSSLQRRSRLDMGVLAAEADRVECDAGSTDGLLFSPNTSLYRAAGRVRFVEARMTGTVRSHHLVAVDEDDALTATLRRAVGGARLEDLAAELVDDDITVEDARHYVHELVDARMLVSDAQPAVTGTGDPAAALCAALHRSPATAPVAERFDTVRAHLAALDRDGLGQPVSRYTTIVRDMRELVPDLDPARLVQVDLVKPSTGMTLSHRVVDELARAVALLHRITAWRPDPMQEFRTAFDTRYGGAEVGLAQVLDEETGIGYHGSAHPDAEESPLLAGIDLGLGSEPARTWSRRDGVLLELLTDALSRGAECIDLADADIQRLAEPDPLPLPDALSIMAIVLGDPQTGQLLVRGVAGPSGAALLGRFCHGDDELTAAVRAHLATEQAHRPDTVFAEVVHLPEGRIGNILRRPVLREYELTYLGRSDAPAERQLTVDDLTVRLDGDRVVLRSRRLDREIVPRLTTAHNTTHNSLGMYRFLADLQNQGVASWMAWDWGPLADATFLPRVTAGRLVLARARWRLTATEVDGLRDHDDVARLRAARKLPRVCTLAEFDNELVVDLDSPPWVHTMLRALNRGQSATLIETLGFHEPTAAGPDGRFTHELVVPFLRPPAPVPSKTPPLSRRVGSVPRNIPPGSDWLYLKIYTGTTGADAVLRTLGPPIRDAVDAGSATRWFFVRYADPDWHIRLRLTGNPEALREQIQPALSEALVPLIDNGMVWRVQLDTYQREIERYGGNEGILLAEQAFHADSAAALGIVEMLSGDTSLDARWRLTLAGTDRLLDDLGFDLPSRAALVRRQRDGFATEFPGGPTQARELGRRYRAERAAIEQLLAAGTQHPLAACLRYFDIRSESLRRIGTELHDLDHAGRLGVPLEAWAASLAHMHANRMLRSVHRAQELVIHDLLDRHYRSHLARSSR